MKSFGELNHYEILRVPPNASLIIVKRAYREALDVYKEDSLVTYSLFTKGEREDLLHTIEQAFLTLSDEKKRAAYNQMLIDTGRVDAAVFSTKHPQKPVSLFSDKNASMPAELAEKVKRRASDPSVKKRIGDLLAKEMISGADLRGFRKALGIEVSEIYAGTNINMTVIKNIENDCYENLPADIYLKSFLKSYADILGIDSHKIIAGYLRNKSQGMNL